MATRDDNGRLTRVGMEEVLAAGGSVFWGGANITDPALLPTQSDIDAVNDVQDLPSEAASLDAMNDKLDLIYDKL